MITVETLTTVDPGVLARLIVGYTSHEKYVVSWHDSDDGAEFSLGLLRRHHGGGTVAHGVR
ncbi:MAG: hypothetical protein SF123_10280 [Chloroflexota bacterium]|nr:hypothetical protein [Chloroflexota bacterium]